MYWIQTFCYKYWLYELLTNFFSQYFKEFLPNHKIVGDIACHSTLYFSPTLAKTFYIISVTLDSYRPRFKIHIPPIYAGKSDHTQNIFLSISWLLSDNFFCLFWNHISKFFSVDILIYILIFCLKILFLVFHGWWQNS